MPTRVTLRLTNIRCIETNFKWSCPKCKKELQFKCERTSKFKQKLHLKNCKGKPVETETKINLKLQINKNKSVKNCSLEYL